MKTAKIKINKTVYEIIKMTKHTEEETKGMSNYVTYDLRKKNTKKQLVHNTKDNEFTLWGKHGSYTTQTFPNHIELVN